MVKRVKQHQLEDLSRAKYSLAIPGNWVFRSKDKDYGIDAEVEIFDNDNKPTGLVYWVQLKATESKTEVTARKTVLKIESIKYYKRLDIPVLVVHYSKKNDCFYCKWAHDIDLFSTRKNPKTITVHFSEDEKWGNHSPNKVIKHLSQIRAIKSGRFKLPVPTNFITTDNIIKKTPRGVLISSLRTAFGDFSEFVVLKDNPDDSLLSIHLSKNELTVKFASIAGCIFQNTITAKEAHIAENLAAHSMLGFAIALSQVGQPESMARVLLHKKVTKIFLRNKRIAIRLLPLLLSTSYFKDTLDAISDIIDDEQDNLLEVITHAAALFNSNQDMEKLEAIEAFLHKRLEKYLKIGDSTQIGICHYNLGNHYRNRGPREHYKKSIRHYLNARKYEKNYLNQYYYYHEIGSLLFHCEKYIFSAAMYKKSLENGAPSSTRPLYADALMHSGNYQLAFEEFTSFLGDRDEEEHDEWRLKLICLDILLQDTGTKHQVRHKDEALKLAGTTKRDSNSIKNLEKALELDMLCGLAWFNLGIEYSSHNQSYDAIFAFTMCGLSQTRDIEAWVNAILCCFKGESLPSVFPLILRTAYFFNGENFLEKLYHEFNKRGSLELCEQLADLIEDMLPKQKNSSNLPTIRILGQDGDFHDLSQ